MGAFSRKNDITIPSTPEQATTWGWEPAETVTIKSRFTVGDMETASSTRLASDGKTPEFSMSNVRLLNAMIVRWNLIDEQGRVAEKSERTIEMLPVNYFTPIMETIDSISKNTVTPAVIDPLGSLTSAQEPTLES